MDYSPRYDNFRTLLREARNDAGLTQVELSEILGKPQSYVSKVELGERRIDFIETIDFCEACGADIKKLEKELKNS